jgi:hypothetical protein
VGLLSEKDDVALCKPAAARCGLQAYDSRTPTRLSLSPIFLVDPGRAVKHHVVDPIRALTLL